MISYSSYGRHFHCLSDLFGLDVQCDHIWSYLHFAEATSAARHPHGPTVLHFEIKLELGWAGCSGGSICCQ